MQVEKLKKLERVLSPERLGGYRVPSVQKHPCTSIILYRWNTLYMAIAGHFGDQWLLHPRILDQKEQIEIKKQEILLRKTDKPFVLSELF